MGSDWVGYENGRSERVINPKAKQDRNAEQLLGKAQPVKTSWAFICLGSGEL